ncbi:MAG: SNF2-related protein, partial [Saprospiraceae bacterium]
SQLGQWLQQHPLPAETSSQTFSVPKALDKEEETAQRVMVYAFTKMDQHNLPELTLVPLTARYLPEKDKLSHLGKMENMYSGYGDQSEIPAISQSDSRLLNIAKKSFSTSSLMTAVRATGEQMPRWYYHALTLSELSEPARRAAREYLGQVWASSLPLLRDKITVLSPDNQHRVNSLVRVQVLSQPVKPTFRLREEGDFAILEAFITLDDELIPFNQLVFQGFWLVQCADKIAKIADYAAATVLHQLAPTGSIKVKKAFLPELLQQFVLPLTAQFSVEFTIDKSIDYQPLTYTEGRIYLKEDEENLMLVPMFAYEDPSHAGQHFEFLLDGKKERVTYADDQITVWERQAEREHDFYRFVQALHPDFEQQAGQPFFYLPFGEVLKEQWLFRFFEQAKEQSIPVFGFGQLKKFKYNPNRGAIKIRASSGIDWFDMQVEIAFGDQLASLADVRKAILKKQNYVQLSDGSLGMLPEEWIEKYASLFKFGQVKGDELKLSKLHFSLIDDLYAQIDDEKIQQEIQDKKQKLLYFKEIQDVPLPKNITATLRDYQVEGYKWLNFLDEFSWGGCLADDMGLGKTLQVLSFLQEQKNRFPDAVNLVVVPTTLLFNWQAEVDKFAPELRIHLHRGIGRQRDMGFLKTCDIVLTTYGTLRSDIETFKKVKFNYVVLDESQAIKNPDSLTSKAVKLLHAKNRLVMTGTPVENNTFDLYSQMDFLNPGLLGGQEFFRTEFATPIDKFRDEEKAMELRKLIYPFLLKRTKEEVAKDLPDKTETILYCEMGPKQRKVYDTFREAFRQRIVDKMAVEGKEKSSFLILEALLKLRQICDSPALLSDDADYGNDSAKLDEIIREIEENAGNHKILIFSQFLKMLDLIRQHLDKAGINYEYLDGSTVDRASRVRNFQESKQCRVFLMSLKAGGVGINLTEADYVYLVDPWWNPAVEQQAIDRTHRIGQEKKVFAYKMICKDTVEEKILILQDRKKDIAKDLISTEQGLIKKLTQDDIVGLFS